MFNLETQGNPPTALEKWRSQCVTWLWLKLKDILQNKFHLPLSLEHEKHGGKSVGLHGRQDSHQVGPHGQSV